MDHAIAKFEIDVSVHLESLSVPLDPAACAAGEADAYAVFTVSAMKSSSLCAIECLQDCV